MNRVSMLLAAAGTAALLGATPVRAAPLPPNLQAFLVAVGYLAPLSGVTLNSAQQTAIQNIELTGWSALLPQLKTIFLTHEAIIAQLNQPTLSVKQIRTLEAQKAAALVKIETARITMAIKVRNTLTSAQLAQAAATHVTQQADIEALVDKYFPGAF